MRERFDCGSEVLNRYLQRQASQDMKRKAAAVFVLVDAAGASILGYYALSSFTIETCRIPPEVAARLPRYPHLPATLIGRLAVDRRNQGRRLGEYLLMDALRRSLENTATVGSIAIVVDAKDENARNFYRRYDFISLPDQSDRLFLPMGAVEQLFR